MRVRALLRSHARPFRGSGCTDTHCRDRGSTAPPARPLSYSVTSHDLSRNSPGSCRSCSRTKPGSPAAFHPAGLSPDERKSFCPAADPDISREFPPWSPLIVFALAVTVRGCGPSQVIVSVSPWAEHCNREDGSGRPRRLRCLADSARGAMLYLFPRRNTMAEAKLAPNMPEWQVKHTNLYLASGGTEGHMYKIDVPGRAARSRRRRSS